MGDGFFHFTRRPPRVGFRMKSFQIGILLSALISGLAVAQVTPAHPDSFAKRTTGGGTSGGVEVLPRDGGVPKTVRYVTHIVLSTHRFWTNPEGKIVEGKLIAFEDLITEAPKGAEPPPHPAPPASPTVVRDGKIRLLIQNKPVVTALSRFSAGDLEFVEQVRKAYAKKPSAQP
jgi:hypothetical protein